MNNGLERIVWDGLLHQLTDLLNRVNKKQLLTYLRLANKPLGFLLNFNEAVLKDGVTRIINTPASRD